MTTCRIRDSESVNKVKMDKQNPKSFPSEKENEPSEELSEKYAAGPQNPLQNVCNKILQPINRASRSIRGRKLTCKVLSVKKSEVNTVRSTVETRTQYSLESRNITEHSQSDEVVNNEDKVFVEGEKHHLKDLSESMDVEDCEVETKIAKPLQVLRITPSCSKNKEVRKPQRKITFTENLESRPKICSK